MRSTLSDSPCMILSTFGPTWARTITTIQVSDRIPRRRTWDSSKDMILTFIQPDQEEQADSRLSSNRELRIEQALAQGVEQGNPDLVGTRPDQTQVAWGDGLYCEPLQSPSPTRILRTVQRHCMPDKQCHEHQHATSH